MATDWTVSNYAYELARTLAKERASAHWNAWMVDKTNANMWETYHSALNANWVDPWFEHETYGIENDPATDYEITQNMYMIYCWLSLKGYSTYAQTAMMTTWIQESTETGGNWEAGNHPYSSITSFDPTSMSLYGTPTNYQDIRNWAHVWFDRSGNYVSWTPSMVDGYTGDTVSLNASGTWAAVKRFPLLRQTVEIDGAEYIRPVLNDRGEPILNINAPGNPQDGRGYGLAQWTPWTKLPDVCAFAYNEGDTNFDEANRHWQINLTLQLMILEKHREWAMAYPQASPYRGQWVDGNATQAGFTNPLTGTFVNYPQPLSWDKFAQDYYLTWVNNTLDSLGVVNVVQREWCKRQTAINIWSTCFEQGGLYDFTALGFQQKSLYVWSAIKYWDDNGGWSVIDIPRARDIPNCELDSYHMSTELLLSLAKRRGKHHVRTILL